MSDLNHALYTIISTIITIGIFVLAQYFIKKDEHKQKFLQATAIITVLIHYSSIYVSFFKTGIADVDDSMLFPIYPCNVAMWLLFLSSFIKNKNGRFFKVVAEFTFYLGIVGGVVGIIFNENYMRTPNLLDWDILKGLLSHSTMIIGALYLAIGKFIKIRVSNVISVIIGLLFLIVDGAVIITIFKLANLDAPNCMYLLENPFPSMPNFSTLWIGVIAVIVAFIFTSIFEFFALPKEERWYAGISQKLENKIKHN